MICIEQPEFCNIGRVTRTWLSKEERQALKAGLERARQKRAAVKRRQKASEPFMSRSRSWGDISRFEDDHERNKRWTRAQKNHQEALPAEGSAPRLVRIRNEPSPTLGRINPTLDAREQGQLGLASLMADFRGEFRPFSKIRQQFEAAVQLR